ncbi:SDR family NAD(P)-dependent oxidoreductase [Streptomyces roseoverticillatus]|uniref:type I polyketide synthase n=1 Tax=Streptomyces roseoverticillatus TaxID=66429 RepID=UPI001F3D89A2|nr:type I polyketide synthase [Streptomyces roseoverticillatus]MCF3103237.1 SDR family NAD(P)-dependent oxidoreductase [Streptomyces roseoverticillatus]
MTHFDTSGAVAVVGTACRLPGGITTLDGLWSALTEGRDLVGELPADRFDPGRWFDPVPWRPAKTYTLAGGFLDDIHGFDAAYFGMSPREASRTDPQQRIFLEMAVEALDDAGIAAASLAGSGTAVYAGVSSPSFAVLQGLEERSTDAYTMTGSATSNVANRVSHFLDLHGPSLAVDTACSSALVALHHACEALRTGRCETALAGGVHALLSPFEYVGFAKASMLSPTGRCRTFSAAADGYARAEGGGLVVLKELSRAMADGDRVHAVILGSGVNTDGRTPGLAQPSADAQEALLREVYERARIDADDIAYLELHGTGTPIGDPAECRAVGRALGTRRAPGRPLPVGSVKSNMGHLEPASGMAGLFKAMLVLRHGRVPANLHALPLNPAIDFDGLQLAPATEPRELEQPPGGRAVAGVNSFGFGGANAHVVVTTLPGQREDGQEDVREDVQDYVREGAQAEVREDVQGDLRVQDDVRESVQDYVREGAHDVRDDARAASPLPVVVSARTPEAAAAAAERMAQRLDTCTDQEFYDLAYTAARRRGHHAHRAAVLAGTPAEAASLLRGLAAGEQHLSGAMATAAERGSVALAFSGNGSQWAGMGADLLAAEPVFRAAVAEADDVLRPLLGWSVREELVRGGPPDRTDVAQPLMFAVQVGLVEMLRASGVRPAGVVGHSSGEMAAAWAAGVLELDAAALVVVERSRAQQSTAGDWGMAAIGADERSVGRLLEPYAGRLEIAGVNTARDVTVSGDKAALAALGRELTQQEIFFQDLGLDYAFHSHAMDGLADRLVTALYGVKAHRAHTPYASATTGTLLTGTEMDADYWWQNLRRPVQFAPAVAHLRDLGCDVFVEVGPHPVLSGYLRRPVAGHRPTVVPTLSRQAPGPAAVRAALSHLVAAGTGTEASFFPRPGRVVDLPAYPWERERHWNGEPGAWARRCGDGSADHPLLGERADLADPSWHGLFDPARTPWLEGHRIAEAVLMPATGFTEMALAAGRRAWDSAVEVTDLTIPRALVLPFENDRELRIQTTLSTDDGLVRIASRGEGTDAWQEHARGRVRRLLEPRPEPVDIGRIAARLPDRWTAEEFYRMIERVGVRYGPDFLVLGEDLHIGPDESLTRYTTRADLSGYEAHPALLDGAVQTGLVLLEDLAVQGEPSLPASLDRVRAWRPLPAEGHFHARLRARSARESLLDLTVLDPDGQVCLSLEGVRLRRFDRPGVTGVRHHLTVMRVACRPGQDLGPSPLPGPAAVADACRGLLHEADETAHVFDAARELAAHFGAAAVAGLLPGPGAFTKAEILDAGAIAPYAELLDVLLDTACAHGLAAPVASPRTEGDRWRIVRAPAPQERVRELTRRHPGLAVEIALLGTCGSRLPDVLRGRLDAADVLHTATHRPLLEELHAGGGLARFGLRALRTALESVVAGWPVDRPLRILEVGAGSGGTTASLLPLLPPDRTQYVCTDVSDTFFPRAQRQFRPHDFVSYQTLDLDQDPVEQGLPEAGFDIVIAGHALHTASDVRRSLAHLGTLLADDGHLLATETHDPAASALLYGLLPGFWTRHDTGLRPSGPLLAPGTWKKVLSEAGYAHPLTVGHGDSFLLLAGRPHRPRPAPAAALAQPSGAWIVAAESDGDPLADALARQLGARRAAPGTEPAHWSALLDEHPGDLGVVLLLDADEPGADGTQPAPLDTGRAVHRLAALRALVTSAARRSDITLWLATPPTGALPAPERPLAPQAATLWGAARCISSEHPQLAVRRISLERGYSPEADAARLAAELADPTTEDEILLTPSGRFVPRIHARPALTTTAPAPRGTSFALRLRAPGRHYRLAWVPAPAPRPGPDEVLVSVRAAALNYRDVLQSLDLIPLSTPRAGEARGKEPGLGLECAGVVTAVGSRVTRFAVGDRVFGFGSDMLASHATVQENLTGRMPDGMDFCQAATLPGVYLTVHHSLHRLARLEPGETVLVHGAAGGVGLATLQYAAHAGAHVIATAGTPAKRDLLRLLGVQHVLDSRSLDFAHQVKDLTGGRGVDVVLNSLAGEAISRGLESLRSGGRFIELGKRDLYGNTPLLLRPFLNNLTLSAVGDIHELLTQHPEIAGVEGPEIARRVREGVYGPILHHVYPADRITDAFETLQHSRHIGKVVISLETAPQIEQQPAPPALDPQATYLVTGGLTGFGAATAEWLARHGARRLALTGRRGANTPEAPALLDTLHRQGVYVTTYAADAADADAMRAVLAAADTHEHPLRGVVHAAAVFDDGPLMDLTDESLRHVLAPKAAGASVLDQLTRDRDLTLFLLHSSVTGLTGNLHQSHYAAANVYLEALARARRRTGRRALAVGWGAVADVGHAARNDMTAYLGTIGLPSVPAAELLEPMGALLTRGDDVAVLADIDWNRARQLVPPAARFSTVLPADHGTCDGDETLARRLADATPETALALITDVLTHTLADILQTPPDRLSLDRSLTELGVDSLMGAELMTALQKRLGCTLPMPEIVNSTSITDLARRCLHWLK